MMQEIAALPTEVHILIGFLFSLLIGSFLNVVIYRYPKMIFYAWTMQSRQWLDSENDVTNNDEGKDETSTPPSLSKPASHCRVCKSPVKAWQNIPIVSYALLRGKCATCKTPIGLRYPFVELLTATLCAVVIYKLGWTLAALFAVFLTWVLVALSFIDFDHKILPDEIVLPVLWLGLSLNVFHIYTNLESAVIGAIGGYLCFWLVFKAFLLITKKEGMGHGDFKLMSLLGAWLGWQFLPQIIFLSTLVGSVFGISMMIANRSGRDTQIPFGPYIAFAGWIAMLWGNDINQTYLNYAGL